MPVRVAPAPVCVAPTKVPAPAPTATDAHTVPHPSAVMGNTEARVPNMADPGGARVTVGASMAAVSRLCGYGRARDEGHAERACNRSRK